MKYNSREMKNVRGNVQRFNGPVHTKRLRHRHRHRNVDGKNVYATHSVRHSSRQHYGDRDGIAFNFMLSFAKDGILAVSTRNGAKSCDLSCWNVIKWQISLPFVQF